MAETIDTVVEVVRDRALQIGVIKQVQPMVFLLKNGRVRYCPLPDYVQPREALPILLRNDLPDAYVILVEGRVIMFPKDEPFLEGFQRGDIADNPDNPSVLIISAVERHGRVRLMMAEAETEEFPRSFKPWQEYGDDDTKSGALVITQW